MIPEYLREVYPNPVQYISDTPVFVFRDHRWTLPVLHLASERGLLSLPAVVVSFDRHRDSLAPGASRHLLNRFSSGGSLEELAELVSRRLSPRDDDWLLSGMEAGLISDAVRFGTEPDGMERITRYHDGRGVPHQVYHLERLAAELEYKGALADSDHPAVSEGLWETLAWDPRTHSVGLRRDGMLLDIDLDFFTMAWGKYTIPFLEEVYRGEFLSACQSLFSRDYRPVDFFDTLVKSSGALTIACEPDFCGGETKARKILEDMNRLLLGRGLITGGIRVDYPPDYPVE